MGSSIVVGVGTLVAFAAVKTGVGVAIISPKLAFVGVGVFVALGVAVGKIVPVGVGPLVEVGVGLGVIVPVGVGRMVPVGEGVCVGTLVEVGVGLTVTVGVGTLVPVGVGRMVPVGEGLIVPVGVGAATEKVNRHPGAGVIFGGKTTPCAAGFDSGTEGATGFVPNSFILKAVKTDKTPKTSVKTIMPIITNFFFILNYYLLPNSSHFYKPEGFIISKPSRRNYII